MTDLRSHLASLDAAGDLLRIESRVHWTDAAVVGGEAAERNGPGLLFEDSSGCLRLASGVYGGPDGMEPRDRKPWARLSQALGGSRSSYLDCLDAVSGGGRDRTRDRSSASASDDSNDESIESDLDATAIDTELYSLGLPAIAGTDRPALTLALCAYESKRGTVWTPFRGIVRGGDRLSGVVPRTVADSLDETRRHVSVTLGVPAAALVAAYRLAAGDRLPVGAPVLAREFDAVPVASRNSITIPAESEVVIEGHASTTGEGPTTNHEAWEDTVETATIEIEVTEIATREDPVVPFAPTHAPLSDDIHLVSITEAARLTERINSYWGIEPVSWLSLPVETGLGMCLVASEILYAGFEWQLANTLFSFSRLFDKVLVLDETIEPADLARSFDDIWVRAHPSHDWEFSEPSAPAATRPSYRSEGETGSRLYINAAWDPRWDESYIAPRVTFESSFPKEVRETVREQWPRLGFDGPFRGGERT